MTEKSTENDEPEQHHPLHIDLLVVDLPKMGPDVATDSLAIVQQYVPAPIEGAGGRV